MIKVLMIANKCDMIIKTNIWRMNDLINEEMLELVKTEEELFDLWKKRRLVFCEDGILNKEMYDKSEIKVLFALKDVNKTPNIIKTTKERE